MNHNKYQAKLRHHDTISDNELSECDREDLCHIGFIQGDCGHLLFIQYPSGTIVAHDNDIHDVPWIRSRDGRRRDDYPSSSDSEDTRKFSPPSQLPSLVGCALQKWIPYPLYRTVYDCVDQMRTALSQRTFHFYSHHGRTYALSISSTLSNFSVVGIEIEEISDSPATSDSFCSTLVHLGRIVEFYANETIASTACDAVFSVMGKYDRGMVYRFNDDLSGEVIHEIRSSNVETTSYLGLRFPSSDIPLPARELYIKNGLRYIHNLEEENVPVVSNGQQVDLTQIRMRAVAKPHVIYLRNMGVMSSLSLAIVVDGELWGLLAFHGYTVPFTPSLHQRIACETIVKMVSVRIEAMDKKAQSSRIIRLGEVLLSMNHDRNLIVNLEEIGDPLLSALDCDLLFVNTIDPRQDKTETLCIGDSSLKPSHQFWKAVATVENRKISVVSNRDMLLEMGLTEDDCPARGALFFREGRMQIMLGRAMRARDVMWAGNPDEPKLRIGGILNPRNSFETYMEKARLEAKAWSREDLNVVSVFRDRVCEHCHHFEMTLLQQNIADTNKKYLSAIDRAQENYEFFARMSHELRTPFHGVMGCLEILEETFENLTPEDIHDIIRTATASGSHMIELLNDILDISKNSHLSHAFARNKVSYRSLASDAIDCMRTLATSQSIRFSSEILPEDAHCKIVTDRKKVIQIISNIVNNAIKFTKNGFISVKFRLVDKLQEAIDEWEAISRGYSGMCFTMKEGEMLTNHEDIQRRGKHYPHFPDRRWLMASVVDSGCGMKPSELVSMFAPYTQANSGSNRTFRGTGLGLFICVSLCTQLSGFIACASTPNRGTVFQIGIPVELVPNEEDTSSAATPVAIEGGSAIVLSGPIMVVDDNDVNIKILKRQIEILTKAHSLDLQVVTASCADSALQLFKTVKPGLCFIDYHMPVRDGLDVTRDIRTWEAENDANPAYILCYTADATDKAKETILEAGCNDIMYKPPPKGFLDNLIRRLHLQYDAD